MRLISLRHRAVEAPQTRLDVADGNVELGCCERRGQGGVDVARKQHEIWFLCE